MTAQMSAVVVRSYEPYVASVEPRPVAEPGPSQVRLRVRAAGISFVDALTAPGGYQTRPDLPYVPGSECAGVVDALGEGVEGYAVGQAVAALGWGGVYAEAMCAPATALSRLPTGASFEEGAVLRVAYTTAHHALIDCGALKAGETVLVLGAAGSVGQAAIQIAKATGAYVVAAAHTEDRREAAGAAGADQVIGGAPETLRDELAGVLGGRSLDVTLDPVGGAVTEPAFRALGWGGRHLVIGFVGGEPPALKTNLPLLKGAALVGVNVGRFTALDPAGAAAGLARVLDLYGRGLIRPRVDHRFPLAEFEAAMTLASSGSAVGRIVLTMGER